MLIEALFTAQFNSLIFVFITWSFSCTYCLFGAVIIYLTVDTNFWLWTKRLMENNNNNIQNIFLSKKPLWGCQVICRVIIQSMEGALSKRKFNLFSVTNYISHSSHDSIYISSSFTWRSSVANFINLASIELCRNTETQLLDFYFSHHEFITFPACKSWHEVVVVSVNWDEGVNKCYKNQCWKSKIKKLLQQIIQCEFPCRQTARLTPNYTFLFIVFLNFLPCHPPAALKNTSFFPHRFLLFPSTLLSLFKAAIYFHFYHFIHSPNDNINDCITFWKRDEGSKKRWIYILPLLPSHLLSTYQMYASLGRARHMEMEW